MNRSAFLLVFNLGWAALCWHNVALGDAPVTGSQTAPTEPLSLWYREPARQWVEALPIGNGRLGAMVFGGVNQERMQLNEDTLWAGGPYDPVNPEAAAALPEARRLIFEGKYKEADRLISPRIMAKPLVQMPYETIGDLLLTFPEAASAENYRRDLNLDTAVATVRYTVKGVTFTRETFSSPVDQVIVVRLTANRKGAISFSAEMRSPQQAVLQTASGDTLILRGSNGEAAGIKGALTFQASVRVAANGGQTSSTTSAVSVRNAEPLRRFLRLQKWGVWEHLDEGKGLLQSIQESDEYTDYWLDRRLGCRQLGMNLCRRFFMRRLTEAYRGKNDLFRGQQIRSTYFEREYLSGIATDKLPADRYARPGYALKLAGLIGQAAAASIIVGRSFDEARPAFDDGDEIVREGEDGLPFEVLVGDHSGAFTEYKRPLTAFAADYARPVNVREALVANPDEFANAYLSAFRDHFVHTQGDYRKRRRAFDTLFKHCKYDPAGSFAYRWECVLQRLDQTDPEALLAAIRAHIRVLESAP